MYFKCKLCKLFRKERYGCCIVLGLKHGGADTDTYGCSYGTFFSVWKWSVIALKYLLIVGGCALTPFIIYWAFTRGITAESSPTPQNVMAGVIIVATIVSVLVSIIAIPVAIRRAFRKHGGKYKP